MHDIIICPRKSFYCSFFPPEGSATTVSGSFDVLRENEGRLKDMVRQRFREAAASDTQADVERFGRLFPLLNLHEEGLDLYANYLRSKVPVCVCGGVGVHSVLMFVWRRRKSRSVCECVCVCRGGRV